MLTAIEKHRIITLLRQLGCNEREASLYILCISLEPASVQELARKSKANRFTVHSAVEQLIAKGFLAETRRGKRRLITAEPPEVLAAILERKRSALEQLTATTEYVAQLLLRLQPSERGVPTVRFYEGTEGYVKMLEETLTTRGELLIFSYAQMLADLVGADILEGFFRKRAKRGISTRLILPPCPFADRLLARSKEYCLQIRLLPKGVVWKSGVFSYNDAIALLSYTEQRLTCTIIENRDIADFYRRIIFEMCWAQAEVRGE